MGSASDPISVRVTTQTQSPDGTTRSDLFYMSSTLNAYSSQLAANIATPIYNQVMKEYTAQGSLATPTAQYAGGDAYLSTQAGGSVSLRAVVQVGLQAATPVRYHLTKQDTLSTPIYGAPNLTVGGQVIYNWIDGILKKLTVQNLYTGAPYTNG